MGRAVVPIVSEAARKRAASYVARAPIGTRVTFQGPQRTVDQNAKMWAMLTDFSRQVVHFDRRYDAGAWKEIFLAGLGREARFAPTLDGDSIIALGRSSSDLSKQEMSDMIEMLYAEGAKRGVKWSEP
jgi:hypothetical protein